MLIQSILSLSFIQQKVEDLEYEREVKKLSQRTEPVNNSHKDSRRDNSSSNYRSYAPAREDDYVGCCGW